MKASEMTTGQRDHHRKTKDRKNTDDAKQTENEDGEYLGTKTTKRKNEAGN
jgi:hypothetical protein